MLSDDVTVLNIKHKVLQEVAKLAYDKKLEEGEELLPFPVSYTHLTLPTTPYV